ATLRPDRSNRSERHAPGPRCRRPITCRRIFALFPQASSGLLPAEIRPPLLEERRDALDEFVAVASLALEVALAIELRVETVDGGRGQGPLDQAVGVGGAGREPLGKRARFAHQVG